jgi:hypothetical protein
MRISFRDSYALWKILWIISGKRKKIADILLLSKSAGF